MGVQGSHRTSGHTIFSRIAALTMRVLLFLSSVLTAQCYILYPLPYAGLRFLPYQRFFKLQTAEPMSELEVQPVVISGFDDFDCPDVGLFPDEESGCEMYWVCNKAAKSLDRSKKPFHYACNPGQLFDASIGACNEESLVDDYCNINKPNAPETAPIVLELPEDSVKFQCPGDGAYAHQESGCEKYFVCNGGRFWIYNCNPGLLFDAKIGQCNWPDLVDGYCNAGPDQRFFKGDDVFKAALVDSQRL